MTVNATTRCPAWCAGDHLPTWRVHTHRAFSHTNPFTEEVVDVSAVLHDYDGQRPQVEVTTHTDDETATFSLAPGTALHLGETLRMVGQGGQFADALVSAAQTILGEQR